MEVISGSRTGRVLAADNPAPASSARIPDVQRGLDNPARGESGQHCHAGHDIHSIGDRFPRPEKNHPPPSQEISLASILFA